MAAWRYCGQRGLCVRNGVSWFDKYNTAARDFETVFWYLTSYGSAEGCLCLLPEGFLEGFFCETTDDTFRAKLVGQWSRSDGNYSIQVHSVAVSSAKNGAMMSVQDAPACWAGMQTSQFVFACDTVAPRGLPNLTWDGVFRPHDRYEHGSKVIHGN